MVLFDNFVPFEKIGSDGFPNYDMPMSTVHRSFVAFKYVFTHSTVSITNISDIFSNI